MIEFPVLPDGSGYQTLWNGRDIYTLSDQEFHEYVAEHAQTDPQAATDNLDYRYHDHLPEGANCRWCGIEHAAINPQNLE